MKTCPVCQKFVTDQAKFCYYCGASLLNVAPDAPEPEPQPVEATVEPVVEAVEEPVVEAIEESVEAIEEPVEAIEETVEAVEEPVEAVEEPVVEAVEEPVFEAVEEPVVETIEAPAPVEPVVEPVSAPIVTPVAAPVQEPVVQREAPAAQPVVNATDSRSLMTTAGYIFTTILFHIPVVGLIFMIVWGCGKPKNISRKRFSLAMLILRLLGVIACLLIVVFMLICFSEKIPGWYHSVIG